MLKKIKKTMVGIIRPPPARNASEWADYERILPPGSPEPGRWRSSRTPFMYEFLAAGVNPLYSTIVFCCGSQMGKTENVLNIAGHRMTDGPFVPILFVFPTERLARSMSNDRFKKMIASTKVLYDRLEKGQANKVMEKFFNGIRCGFGYAGSATELSSHPAGLVLIDEIDRMSDVSGEGDPYLLAKARTKNYVDSKVIITSTPTLENHSRIWALWESGTMGRWSWCCIHCKKYFVPVKDLLRHNGNNPTEAAQTAFVVCPLCGGQILTKHREKLNQSGRYEYCIKKDENIYENIGPVPTINSTASFWASGLASPWQSFGEIAYLMETAYKSGDQGTIQGAVNTYLGETHKLRGDAPNWQIVKTHVADYDESNLPDQVQLVTMGVDVQEKLLYYCIRGYGYRGESWLIRNGEIHGNTVFDQVWIELAGICEQKFKDLPISRVFVDSGYTPGSKFYVRPDNKIHHFCRLMLGQCYPSKGKDQQQKPLISSKIDVTVSGKVIKDGMTLWHVDTDYFKRQIYGNLRKDNTEKYGWHCLQTISDDYCKQVTAEECITLDSGKRQWVTIRDDNHYLDCEVLCDAAAYSAGVYNLADNTPLPKRAEKKEDNQPKSFIKTPKHSFFRRS